MKDQFPERKSAFLGVCAKCYLGDETGATAIEYALIASLIGVMIMTGANALGGSLADTFENIAIMTSDLSEGPPKSGTPPPPKN